MAIADIDDDAPGASFEENSQCSPVHDASMSSQQVSDGDDYIAPSLGDSDSVT